MRIKYRAALGVVDKLDKTVGFLFKIMLLPLLLIAAYAIYDTGRLEISAIKAASLANEFVDDSDDSVNFEALRQRNEEVVAWLRIPDTNIDFPVMQARDNSYYLSRDIDKSYAITGAIFLDYRNSGDLSDDFSIIYGHRMSNGRMFSDVGKFEDKEFFYEHQWATLYTPEQKLTIRFVAFASVYGVQGEIYQIGAFSDKEAISKVLEKSKVLDSDGIARGGKYVLLSTCSAKEQSMRDVLLGVLEE